MSTDALLPFGTATAVAVVGVVTVEGRRHCGQRSAHHGLVIAAYTGLVQRALLGLLALDHGPEPAPRHPLTTTPEEKKS